MAKHSFDAAFGFAFLFAVGPSAHSAERVLDILQRQTQELVDAIAPGSAATWDRYLDAREP